MGCGRVLKISGWGSREGGLCVTCTLFMFILELCKKNGVFLAGILCGECSRQLWLPKLLPQRFFLFLKDEVLWSDSEHT